MNSKHRKNITLKMPFIELIRAVICFLKLDIIFIALRGLRILRVRRDFRFTIFQPLTSPANSKIPAMTMKKSN